MVFEPENKLNIAVARLGGSNHWHLCVWSDSIDRAEDTFRELRAAYLRESAKEEETAEFEILTVRRGEPDSRTVSFNPKIRNGSELSLHYGDEFEAWHIAYLQQIKNRSNGVTILQGVPGTGKTSYLRHLAFSLHKSHRFYITGQRLPIVKLSSSGRFLVLGERPAPGSDQDSFDRRCGGTSCQTGKRQSRVAF